MTRNEARSALLNYLASHLGADQFQRLGSDQLRAFLDTDTEARLCFRAAGGTEPFDVSVIVGPRFKSIERTVNLASRLAGASEAKIRSGASSPTLFVNLSDLGPIKPYVRIDAHYQIRIAIQEYAIPMIKSVATIPSAAAFALNGAGLAFGHHAEHIPILLYKSGLADDAESFMQSAAPEHQWLADYYLALRSVLDRNL